MKEQTRTAIKIFTEIYGMPSWEKETKDGQSYDEIVSLWDRELGEYSTELVKSACYHVIKYRKAMTFPTISHLLAELCDEEKGSGEYKIEQGNTEEANRVYVYLRNHAKDITPPASRLASQKTIWNLYGVAVDGYNPNERLEKNNPNPHACRDELDSLMLKGALKTIKEEQ